MKQTEAVGSDRAHVRQGERPGARKRVVVVVLGQQSRAGQRWQLGEGT